MNLTEVLNFRRSVRVYDSEKPLDTEKVRHCLELATLAPNSSNMQLWEFYHVTQPKLMAEISRACSSFFGLIGAFRIFLTKTVGLFRTITREVSENDVRVVVHKSCALAAQTFMIAMANEGYDSKVLKKALKLPRGAEVNMVVSCGIRKGNEGVWGERCRVPFEEVYHKI